MDVQVENAIEIAWNPSSDQTLKSQAFNFINELRSNPQGWQICLSLATRAPRLSEVVRHVSLDIVNNAIQTRQIDVQALVYIRDSLLSYTRNIYRDGDGISKVDSISIQNKLIQTLTYLFTVLYTTEWPLFFGDMLSLTSTSGSQTKDNIPGIVLYLRLLISIHDEVADVLVPRSSEEQKRDTELKDLVRQRDAVSIARSWQEILSRWRSVNNLVVEQCLTTIGRWVSWTDISLVVNETLLDLLFNIVSLEATPSHNDTSSSLRDAAVSTFSEIISKKMSADDKLELIEILKLKDVVSQLIASPALSDLRSTSNYDTDMAESIAKLVNIAVYDIVRAVDGARDSDLAYSRGNDQIRTFLPFVLRFFSDEYDEVCSSVIPCLTDLLTLFRKKGKSNSRFCSENAAMLPPILDAIVLKMKYDETSSWGTEDAQTDEAEFQELRKRLHILQHAVAAVDEALYMDKITNIVSSTFEKMQSRTDQLDWRDMDLALYEMFLFGEFAMKNGGLYSKTKPVSPAAECLVEMMYKLVETDVASFSHPAVHLQYMEICVRYSTFFDANPQHVPKVLEHFVRFVHHSNVKVKIRSWYLFQRFVRHMRQNIGNIAQTVIQALSDLLAIKAELPEEVSEDDVSSDDNDQSAGARFSSQLYLYEAIGTVCSSHTVPANDQALYIKTVISPLFIDLEAHLGQARNGDERAVLQIHHLIMALGTLARGFSDWTPANTSSSTQPPAPLVSQEFESTAEAILTALESLSSSFEIRTAARFAFSRLVGVLGNRILPQLPRWINGLLSRTSSKDEMGLFLRLLDQVVYGFKTEIYSILDALLTPFLQRVFGGMSEPSAGTDDEIQLAELKREYLSFLLVILNNGLESVFVSITNQPVFDAVISTIEHLAKDVSDIPTAKLAFSVLIKIVQTWGGPDVVSENNTSTTAPQPTLPGFDNFMMTRLSPLCWAIPATPNFDTKDAQGKQLLGEAAGLQKAIYTKIGRAYMSWLRDVELKGMGMNDNNIGEYVNALSSMDGKGFRQFFQNLIQQNHR